jgi:GNAT superfamily N-acetyltransferase
MGITEAGAVPVQRLEHPSREDFADLQQLVIDSRWNQLAADWLVFLELGSVHVVRTAAGRIVASGAVLPMGAVAWISMILVTPARRGAGLGRAVFGHCLRAVQAEGRVPMLDATPAGETLYGKFGWRREARPGSGHGAWTPCAPDALAALDARSLGFDRRAVLARLLGRPRSRCVASGEAVALLREGRTALHIGPLLGRGEAAAVTLLKEIIAAEDAALLVDLRDDRPQLRAALEAAGFRHERPFARMALLAPGQVLPRADDALLHAVAGPEYA